METLSLTVKTVEDAERFCEEFKEKFEEDLAYSSDIDEFLEELCEEENFCYVEEYEFEPLFLEMLPEEKMKDFVTDFAKTCSKFELAYTWESDNSNEGRRIEYKKKGKTLAIKDYFSSQGLMIDLCYHCDEEIDPINIQDFNAKKYICPHCNEEIEYDVDYSEETIEL